MARSRLIVNVFKWNVKKEELVNGVQAILVVCGKVGQKSAGTYLWSSTYAL